MPFCRDIYFYVEGDDDKRFFERIVKKLILKSKKYENIHVLQWRQKKEYLVKNFIKKYLEKGCKVVFVRDYDNSAQNNEEMNRIISSLEEETMQRYNIKSKEDIFIVRREIESWYRAGIKNNLLKKYHITPIENTNTFSKEEFERLIPEGMSQTEFLIEIVENFDVKLAKKKNSSFKDFMTRMKL
ncbi:hypothetical protein LCGC14_0679140 [marine sediment metagenome]|uniref:DUF4435 domain-containing protein n=1 Tax=marine sediment metagenome TaxID=412755 RepID=A0A0F9QNS5_9ZZZZ|nr:MAG: hypothetical protein Lokiarch_33370 [Candidatus Lokiarchaeum sp. GC14_75]